MRVVTVPFAELSKRDLLRVAREQADMLSAIQISRGAALKPKIIQLFLSIVMVFASWPHRVRRPSFLPWRYLKASTLRAHRDPEVLIVVATNAN